MSARAIALLTAPIMLAQVASSSAQHATSREELLGTWRLLSFYDESIDTGKKTNVFGENPRGLLILTNDGRIALTLISNARALPKGPAPTDQEAAVLFKTMLAYVGRYTIDPAIEGALGMTVRSEVASNPRLEGADRKFIVRTDGDMLIFKTTPPTRNPGTGEMTTRNVILEREP
jgi:hypothetical protein